MRAALGLARRGLGRVWPNPAVGCVLVRPDSGAVVGRGWTQPGGRPHAETEALRRAGVLAKGATAYVTLEPCAHRGATPPCADALIAAEVGRAVVALKDPDPRVDGAGVARLEAAGIPVTLGVRGEEAAEVNAGFLTRVREGRPLFTLKVAATLDGRIAARGGDSRWITGEEARAAAHRLRAEHDAVMIGIGTALADDPLLTCRLPGLEDRRPVRIVLDSRLRLPPACRLARTAKETPTWLVTVGPPAAAAGAVGDAGVEVIAAAADPWGRPELAWVGRELARRGLTRVLVEGGGTLAAALVKAGLADRLAWFRAPRLVGGDGIPAAGALGLDRVDAAPRLDLVSRASFGADVLEVYRFVKGA
jgi:diaminohydroxyphosphoribosylaminopyrimidine deaminase/5-amino-6-(5-phosphoribosylamino)uracil reductase